MAIIAVESYFYSPFPSLCAIFFLLKERDKTTSYRTYYREIYKVELLKDKAIAYYCYPQKCKRQLAKTKWGRTFRSKYTQLTVHFQVYDLSLNLEPK